MDILVTVSRKRKCPASLDWQNRVESEGYWILSFGDRKHPDQDVEVEFTQEQLESLKKIVNVAEKPKHSGWC